MDIEQFKDFVLYEHARTLGYSHSSAKDLKGFYGNPFADDHQIFKIAYMAARYLDYSAKASESMANSFLDFYRSL